MKKFKLVETVGELEQRSGTSFDWNLCVLCQSVTGEPLQCPNDTKRTDVGAGYRSLATSIEQLSEIGALPSSVRLSDLNEGKGVEAALCAHSAKWHKSCRNDYNKTKVDRALKRKATLAEASVDSADETADVGVTAEHFTRSSAAAFSASIGVPPCRSCFFCDKPEAEGSGKLHQATTFDLDARVRSCAHTLHDSALIAKLSDGDMIAIEAHYHSSCLTALYRRAAAAEKHESSLGGHDTDTSRKCSLAFAQLVEYISEVQSDSATAAVFKLSELARRYQTRLEQMGVAVDSRIHTTRLKNRLLAHFTGMRAQSCGKEVLLVCDEDIGNALSTACQFDSDMDAMHLVRAAHIVRRDMFDCSHKFSGNFANNCQEKSLPESLTALVQMILEGSSIADISHDDKSRLPATLSISQLLVYNAVKCTRKPAALSTSVTNTRHNLAQETPLPLYLSMMIHAETRKRDIVDKLFSLGLCVSYDRLLQVSAGLANRICDRFDLASGICPPPLHAGSFTTAAVDNIDHNPSSTTAQDSFHGTAISLVQHSSAGDSVQVLTTACDSGEFSTDSKTVQSLPKSYTDLPPVGPLRKDCVAPDVQLTISSDCGLLSRALAKEYSWLEHVHAASEEEPASSPALHHYTWAAYHAGSLTSPRHSSLSVLLPLFREPAHSTAMLCHAMSIVDSAVRHLNPGQVPVLTLDQPLYSIAKQIQWNWPSRYGETHFVLVLGRLHTEMAALKTLGDWLDGSGWTTALVDARVTSAGKADAMLHASHVVRTRHAHQVTAASLYILQQHAYNTYVAAQRAEQGDVLTFIQWCETQSDDHPQFHYWSIVLQLELSLLLFVRSIRQADFGMYVESLSQIVPWFFALDHHHYARWSSVCLRDMLTLESRNPAVAQEFRAGKFTANKSQDRPFSAIGLDHAHEQLNARVKGIGGAVGLTENDDALRRWMVAGPEVARVVSEFEMAAGNSEDSSIFRHHEQTPARQQAFIQQVVSLVSAFENMGNPFLDDGRELYAIDTRRVCDSAVVKTLQSVKTLGQEQFTSFVNERLVNCTTSVNSHLSRNPLPLFKHANIKHRKPANTKLSLARNDCNLFARLYVACQTRSGDLDMFFEHENQPSPPSLSSDGNLRFGTKADLLTCLENTVAAQTECPAVDAIVLDGAAVVQMLHPGQCRTFTDYADKVFLPYIESRLSKVTRLDLVFDQYLTGSLKAATRTKRGSGVRRKVLPSADLPRNWADFLHCDENKTELFHLLASCVISHHVSDEKHIFVTDGSHVLCSHAVDLSGLDPCSHEEADTRMMLHVASAAGAGISKFMIKTVDTDVVVLAIACFHRLSLSELWVAFGTGKHLRYFPIHTLATSLGCAQSNALAFFHAFTGCDTVSCFTGRGKKTAWEVWKSFPDITPTFVELSSEPADVEPFLPLLQRFVVLMYDRTSSKLTVNAQRKHLFTKKARSMEALPPTAAALLQHTKRAVFQSGYCWYQCLAPQQVLPSPSQWGWVDDGNWLWKPFWTTLPDVAKCCPELLKCGCKTGCGKRCKCTKAKVKCTALCQCDGSCYEPSD